MMTSINHIDPKEWENKSREEIQAEISRLIDFKNTRKSEESAIKTFINAVYGAFGSPYFNMYSTDIAEAITLQGQHIIKTADQAINDYFHNVWHTDTEAHQQLGITGPVKKIPDEKDLVIYCDTDSAYVNFGEVLDSCGWSSDKKEFIFNFYKNRFSEYLSMTYEDYAKTHNTYNLQDFEMETISDAAIFLVKKKYILNLIWRDPIDIPIGTEMVSKGIEIIQKSTPPFVRKKMSDILKYIFTEKNNLKYVNVISLLREMKKEFKLQDIEEISMNKGIGDYEKYIKNDRPGSPFEVYSKCQLHVRAAGTYNYMVNGNKKWKSKYQLLKTGDRCKYYYADFGDGDQDSAFGYISGSYPYEFAPAVNYDIQFEKSIISPLNRFMKVLGHPPIQPSLIVVNQLF